MNTNYSITSFLGGCLLSDADIDEALTKDKVKEFRNIMLHYLDFKQKQKVALFFFNFYVIVVFFFNLIF